MIRVGVLASHPIQYHAPWFRALAREVQLKVFYAHRQTAQQQAQADFGVEFEWDMDLLSGYESEFLSNVARAPDVSKFFGCDVPSIATIIDKHQFDLFVVTGWYLKAYWQAVRACGKHRIPVVAKGDSQLATRRGVLTKAVKEAVYRPMLQQFDGFLSVGVRNREYLLHYGVNSEKIFASPHCVDTEWFRERSIGHDKLDTLMGLGCDPEVPVVLFVGKFTEKKRPLDIVLALAQPTQRPQHEPIQAVFVGAGKLQDSVVCTAAQLGVSVRIAGFRNQSALPAIYSAAAVLVLPSCGLETWGLVANEAMACGTPVIVSSAVGCGPDLIVRGKTGAIYPVGNIAALAESITEVLSFQSSAVTAQALAEKTSQYSPENAAQGVLRAAERLLGTKREFGT